MLAREIKHRVVAVADFYGLVPVALAIINII